MGIDLLHKENRLSALLEPKLIYDLSIDRTVGVIKSINRADGEYFLSVLKSPCTDIESIESRRAVLQDFKTSQKLIDELSSLFSRFSELKESQKSIEKDVTRLLSDGSDSIAAARSIMCSNALVLKRALAFVKGFYEILQGAKISSEGLRTFYEACREICERPEYTRLCSLCAKYENYSTKNFMDFKFILREGRVESYSLIDRRYVNLPSFEPKKKSFLLFKKNEPEESAPYANLNPVRGDGYESLNVAALSELSRVFRTVADSVFDKFLHIGRQLAFYRVACALIRFYEENGIPYTNPAFSGERKVDGLYDLYLLLSKESGEIVPNSLEESIGTLIIGSNGSGKTVFMRSFATAQIMAQAGLPIPAKQASLALYDAFASSFSEGEHEPDGTLAAGRFEEEVRSLAEMLDKLPEHSLVLLNEVFQSTAYTEGAEGLYHLLNYFTDSGITWMLVTHLTDLPARFADDEKVAVMKTAENYKLIKHYDSISE